MSDFDKEAERERLREKYEADVEKREATERMSDLLLQGATMTDSHCDNCGDPLFRYDGQEFCPSCQTADGNAGTAGDSAPAGSSAGEGRADADTGGRPVDDDTTAEAADAGVADPETTDIGPAEDADTAPSATGSPEARSGTEPSTETDATRSSAGTNAAGAGNADRRTDASPQRSARRTPPSQARTEREDTRSTRTASPTPAGDAADLDAVEASLSRTIARLTSDAEDETDLARTRDRLAAVREAAAALEAVRDARR